MRPYHAVTQAVWSADMRTLCGVLAYGQCRVRIWPSGRGATDVTCSNCSAAIVRMGIDSRGVRDV